MPWTARVGQKGQQRSDAISRCRDYSKQLNDSRIAILQARDEAIHSILTEAHGQLIALSKNKGKYKGLLADLLVQVRRLSSHVHCYRMFWLTLFELHCSSLACADICTERKLHNWWLVCAGFAVAPTLL